MDPKQLQALANLVSREKLRGRTDRQISSSLRRNPNIPVNSLRQLEVELQAAGISAQLPESASSSPQPPADPIDRIQGVLARGIQGLTAGFANDAIGAVSPELGERFEDDIETSRREDPIIGGVTEIATSLIPSTGIARAGGLLKTGSGLQRIGKGVGIGKRALTGAAQVGAVGAAEGALFAAGNTDDEGVSGRLKAALKVAPITGALGVFTGSLLGTAAGAQQARRTVQEGGSRLAGTAAREAGIAAKPSIVRRGIDEITQAGRSLMRPLEAAGARAVPAEAVQQIIESPILRRELRRIGTPASRKVANQIDDVIAGKRGSVEGLTFEMLDDVRQSVKFQADRLKSRIPDARGRLPSRSSVNAAEGELQVLDEALDAVPGFTESRSLFAQAGTQRRGLKEGRKMFGKGADDFVSAFDELPNDGARRAFREGGLAELTKKLNKAGSVETFLADASLAGSEVQQKLRVILGSDEAFDAFQVAVRTEKGVLTKAKLIEAITKGAGFLVGGTSIAGGAGLIAIQ